MKSTYGSVTMTEPPGTSHLYVKDSSCPVNTGNNITPGGDVVFSGQCARDLDRTPVSRLTS